MLHFEAPRGRRFQIGILILIGLFLGFGNTAFAQDKQVKKEPTKQRLTGGRMFKEHCAVCHGTDAKGDGPVASALKHAPADLTTLAKRHDGKFPEAYVVSVLQNGVKVPAHGESEMPVWGPIFVKMDSLDISYIRILSLVTYIKSLQAK